MLNKVVRKSIIGISKTILPVLLLLLLAPLLLQFSSEFGEANHFFQIHQVSFLIFHLLFYLVLFWGWPKLVFHLAHRNENELDVSQIKLALQARYYLLAALVLLELLVWWK